MMVKFTGISLILIIAFSKCSTKHHDELHEMEKEELLQALNDFNKAFQEGDTVTLKSMIVEDYVHTNGGSAPINKTDWISYMQQRRLQIDAGHLEVVSYNMDETTIRFYDHIAIVSARVLSVTRNSSISSENKFRVTSIWVRRPEGWRRAGFHDTRI